MNAQEEISFSIISEIWTIVHQFPETVINTLPELPYLEQLLVWVLKRSYTPFLNKNI